VAELVVAELFLLLEFNNLYSLLGRTVGHGVKLVDKGKYAGA
jgi:hypothetical protein